nr:hypothetical protein [Tanacetum cinerariifolium]
MPMNSITSRDGRLPSHEVIDDDFCESGVIHFIASFLTFVLHLIHKIFPDEIDKINVDSVIESPKHLSLRQSETVNSRAFAYNEYHDCVLRISRSPESPLQLASQQKGWKASSS